MCTMAAVGCESDPGKPGATSIYQPPATTNGSTTGGMMTGSCNDTGVTCSTEVYFADCSQFPGRGPVWLFLSYDTTVPTDARIEFAVRTADTEDGLGDDSFETISVATEGMELVPPSVPVQLANELPAGSVERAYLELRIKLVDSQTGGTPSVKEWDLQFSCEDI